MMNCGNKNFSWIFIFAAGILWGSMGIFVDILTGLGFTEMQSAAIRICSAAVIYVVFLVFKDASLLKIKLKDFPVFAGLGILSILAMTCFYFLAIRKTSYSVAAILLYTAPVIVSVLSAVLFKEKFGLSKLSALIVAFVGCVLFPASVWVQVSSLWALFSDCFPVLLMHFTVFSVKSL